MTTSIPLASHYTSPEHHRLECERVLWTNWVSVARIEDLAKPGDFVSFDHAGEPLLIAHGKDGVLRAFPNLCRHRGTTLVEGCGHAKSLQCPYHLWTSDLAGKLVGSPGMEKVAGFDRADYGLRQLGVDCWGGWVFVHLYDDAPPLLESVPHLETTYPGAFLERLVRVGSTQCHQALSWKIVVENFIESYHHAGTHPESLQAPYPYQQIREVDNHGEGWSSIEHTPAIEGLEPFTASSVYPCHLFAITRPTGMTWFKMEIPAHDVVKLDIQVFALPELAGDEEFARGSLAILESINAEDVVINRRTWKGLQSRFATMGPLSSYEEGVRRFRSWVHDALG
jgi:phenylpropionate dioxygenase-like ring-hydroxylating dioxygenase large terminal subunit